MRTSKQPSHAAYLPTFILPAIVVTPFRYSGLQVARLKMRGTQTGEYRVRYCFFPGFAEIVTRESG